MKRARRATPKLPHERDESIDAPVAPAPAIKQAASDLADGQQDTDLYTRTREAFERTPRRTRSRG